MGIFLAVAEYITVQLIMPARQRDASHNTQGSLLVFDPLASERKNRVYSLSQLHRWMSEILYQRLSSP